jgi:hypothetical protein
MALMETTTKTEYVMERDYDHMTGAWGNGCWRTHAVFGGNNVVSVGAAIKSFNDRLDVEEEKHRKYFRLVFVTTSVTRDVLVEKSG